MLFAPAGEQGGATTLIFFGQMAAIIAIFYYFFIRPNAQKEKQHRERLSKLKKGDRVVTVGGIIGEIVHLKDDDITVKSGEARIIVQRGRIAEVQGE
jgi:preprotein translocase subunit YajC